MDPVQQTEQFRQQFEALREEIAKVLVGQQAIVRGALCGLLAGGHVLLEGVPGLGKTLLVRTIAQVVRLAFSRIQFTPDLMPADIVGTNLLQEDEAGHRTFAFAPGPVFANILLADEINRATPKTQSALLEAMQEHQVTIGGVTHRLPEPYLVLATQNPIDLEGTYPLPEAQLDRFLLKLKVDYPTLAELGEIVDRTTGRQQAAPEPVLDGEQIRSMGEVIRAMPTAPHVRDYACRLVLATHPGPGDGQVGRVGEFVRFGASPRGAQALLLAAKVEALLDGRYNVAFDDIDTVAHAALRHRIILNFEGEAAGVDSDQIIDEVIRAVPRQPE